MFDTCQGFLNTRLKRFPDRTAPRLGRWTGTALLCGILAACGGGGDGGNAEAPHDPLAVFKQQKLDWQACDPKAVGEVLGRALAMLPQRVHCALMRVPLDYDNPGQGELKIELLRVLAQQPQRRLGTIAFNPGGPGVDGLALALVSTIWWTQARPGSFSETQLREMGNRYDLISFSPRGVGASHPLICPMPDDLQTQDSLTFNRSAENLQHAQHNARLLGQACAGNPLSAHIHTEATARDMDLMRALQGDEQLNYIGYSYGTWLGAWYAGLFPQRVGRMLLDSSVNVQERLDDAFLHSEMAKQRVLDEIVLPYAERHDDRLALGSAAALRMNLLGLASSLKEALFDRMDFKDPLQIERSVLNLSAAVGLNTLVRDHPHAQGPALKALVQNHVFSPLPQTNAAVVPLALDLIAAQEGDDNTPPEQATTDVDAQGNWRLLPAFTVNMSVRCNDTGTHGDEQYWLDISNDYVVRYPMFGGGGVAKPCLSWPTPPRTMPALPAGLQILMLQSRYDSSTPVEGALATLAALPKASMIVVENEYKHGLFPYKTECVDAQVAAYFLHGALPSRISSCAGTPLGGDAGPAVQPPSTLTASTDNGLPQVQGLWARLHGQIGKTVRLDF